MTLPLHLPLPSKPFIRAGSDARYRSRWRHFMAMALSLSLMLSALLALSPPALAADAAYRVDPAASSVQFQVDFLAFRSVTGSFTDLEGKAQFEGGTLAALDATIRTSSVDTGNDDRDAHLRSDHFFDAAAHPTIALKRRRGVRVEELGPEELRQMEPALSPKLAAAIYLPDVGQLLQSYDLLRGLAEAFRRNGGPVPKGAGRGPAPPAGRRAARGPAPRAPRCAGVRRPPSRRASR